MALGTGIAIHFLKNSPASIGQYFNQANTLTKDIVEIGFGNNSEYHLIKNLPADIREKYTNSNIYCWQDSTGKVHYSNTGFPSSGEYIKKWVKMY